MANVAIANNYDNIIQFELVKGNKNVNTRDSLDNRAGKDTEVYAFRTKEEIATMINVLDKHINEAENDNQRQIAYRNKMLFIIGINVGIRGSDLRTLQWSFFFDKQEDGDLNFKTFYTLQPLKQRKQKKYVKLFFNQAVKQVIENYVSEYPIENLDDYLFASRKGDKPVTVKTLWRIIKETANEAGIEQNIGSHSLRKTFGFWCWHEAEDKNKALVVLQQIFNHSSTNVTSKYIGILDDEMKDMFNSIELGLDMI